MQKKKKKLNYRFLFRPRIFNVGYPHLLISNLNLMAYYLVYKRKGPYGAKNKKTSIVG